MSRRRDRARPAVPTMAGEWASFERAVLDGRRYGPDQRREMRRAFYAGAFMVLSLADQCGDPGMSDDQGVELLEALWGECPRFKDDVLAGRA